MRVHTVTVIDIGTATVIYDCGYDYRGPVAACKQTGTQKQKDVAGLQQGQILAGRGAAESGTLLPAYQSILAKPGYDDPTKSAMTLNTLGGLGASFGGAADMAGNRMARTRNSAGYGDTLDELARERGRQTSTAEAGLQEKFGDVALSERDKALSGMSNLYGIDTRTMAELLNPGQASSGNLGGAAIGAGGAIGASLIAL
jgi:hypothetical protein